MSTRTLKIKLSLVSGQLFTTSVVLENSLVMLSAPGEASAEIPPKPAKVFVRLTGIAGTKVKAAFDLPGAEHDFEFEEELHGNAQNWTVTL